MYLMGIGLVSKKTAWLISSRRACAARAPARSFAATASQRPASGGRPQVAHRVHQPAGADGHHREGELLEADEDAELLAEGGQALAGEAEVVDRVLHSDEGGRGVAQLLQGVEGDAHGRATGDVVDHPGRLVAGGQLAVIADQAALGRPDVVGRDHQERVRAGGDRVVRELDGLGQRLRTGGRHHRDATGHNLHGHVHQRVALVHGEGRGLGRGPVHQHAVGALLDLEGHQGRVGLQVHGAIAKGRHEGGNGAAEGARHGDLLVRAAAASTVDAGQPAVI